MGDWAAGQILPDIPRIYTALAEWLACILCMREGIRRFSGWKFWGIAAAAFLIQSAFLVCTGGLDGPLWMLCMAVAVFLMYCFLCISCDISSLDAGYICVKAFVLAEFMASLEWQLHCFLLWNRMEKLMVRSGAAGDGLWQHLFCDGSNLQSLYLKDRAVESDRAGIVLCCNYWNLCVPDE